MSKKIIEREWRSGIDTVGIVLIETVTGQYLAYIGVAHSKTSEEADMNRIADYGAKLTFYEAVGFFPWLKKEQYYDKSKRVQTVFGYKVAEDESLEDGEFYLTK